MLNGCIAELYVAIVAIPKSVHVLYGCNIVICLQMCMAVHTCKVVTQCNAQCKLLIHYIMIRYVLFFTAK